MPVLRDRYYFPLLSQYELELDKTYNKICATSEDSDQPAHPRSLIWVFADRMCLLRPPRYQKNYERKPLPYWVDLQADLILCWSHRSYCRFSRTLTHTPFSRVSTFAEQYVSAYHIYPKYSYTRFSRRNTYTMRCATLEKCPYTICGQRRFRSACAFVQSDLSNLCSLTYTIVSIDSVSGQWRPWSACALAQADLDLRCPQFA